MLAIGICSMCGGKTPLVENAVKEDRLKEPLETAVHVFGDTMCRGSYRQPVHTFVASGNVAPFLKEYYAHA